MSITWKLIPSLVAIMVCCGSGSARADVLLSPIDSIATLNRFGTDVPGNSGASGNTRDGSGFSGGVLDLNATPQSSTTTVWYLKPSDQGGYPGPADPPQTIFYDLGSEQVFDKAAVWQAIGTGWGNPDDIDVDYASALGGGGSFSLADLQATTWTTGLSAAPLPTEGSGQAFSFGANVAARYVKLTMNTAVDPPSHSGQWGMNEFAVVQSEFDGVFSCDFNGGNGPTQTDFNAMSHAAMNSSFTQSQTFNEVFEVGDSLTVDFAGDRTKNRAAISGPFASQSDLLRDWYGSIPGDTIDMDLTLSAGQYLLRTYHHDALYYSGQATLTITDADGTSAAGTVAGTTGGSPTAIGMFSTLIRSDGINPVELDYSALTAQFGINGFTLQVVPEPSALLLALVGMLGLLPRRRRGRKPE